MGKTWKTYEIITLEQELSVEQPCSTIQFSRVHTAQHVPHPPSIPHFRINTVMSVLFLINTPSISETTFPSDMKHYNPRCP